MRDWHIDIPTEYTSFVIRRTDDEQTGALATALKILALCQYTSNKSIPFNINKTAKCLGTSPKALQRYVSAGLQSGLLKLKQEPGKTRNGKPKLTLEAALFPSGRSNIQFFICHTKQGPYIYINPDSPRNREKCLNATKPQSIKDIMKLIDISAFIDALYVRGYDYEDGEAENNTQLRINNQDCLNKRVSCRQIKEYSGCQYMSESSIRNRINLAVNIGLLEKYTNLMTLDELLDMKALKIDLNPAIQEMLKDYNTDSLDSLPRHTQRKIIVKAIAKAHLVYSKKQSRMVSEALRKHKHGFFHHDPIPEKECIMTRAANTYSMSLMSLYTEYKDYGQTIIIHVSSRPNELFASVCKRSVKKCHNKREKLTITGEFNLFDNEPSSYKKAETVSGDECNEPLWNMAKALRVVHKCIEGVVNEKTEGCPVSEVAALDASSCSGNPFTVFKPFSKIQNELFANFIIYNKSKNNISNSYNSFQLFVNSFARNKSQQAGKKNKPQNTKHAPGLDERVYYVDGLSLVKLPLHLLCKPVGSFGLAVSDGSFLPQSARFGLSQDVSLHEVGAGNFDTIPSLHLSPVSGPVGEGAVAAHMGFGSLCFHRLARVNRCHRASARHRLWTLSTIPTHSRSAFGSLRHGYGSEPSPCPQPLRGS